MNLAEVVFAPSEIPARLTGRPSVFLAGTIDSTVDDWRISVEEGLREAPVVILNPHRHDWDSTWRAELDFAPFRGQVEWELASLESASIVAVYFNSTTDAPITLLELGLSARSNERVVVCCPAAYSKRGNVQAVCLRYGITFTDNRRDFVEAILKKLETLLAGVGPSST